jgi:Zn-dependent M28 family amino/carboxypeptidase
MVNMTLRRLTAATLALLCLGSCRERRPPPAFDDAAAFKYLETQVGFGPRIPGTPGHVREAAWLDSMLRQRADTLIVQRWTHVTHAGDSLPLTNFIARFNPAASERILFLAHWDTRPVSDSPTSRDSTKPVPGANDGASGVALLLGVADALRREHPAVGVDLLFDDGEDYGSFTENGGKDALIGSRYYAAHQPPGPKPLYAVLFDMVADKDQQFYQEGNSLIGAPEVVELVWQTAKEIGHGDRFIAAPAPYGSLIDDHVELQRAGIRAIDVVDFTYPAWHTPDDTIDKVSPASLKATGQVALALVKQAATK